MVIKSIYDVQKNILSVAKSYLSKAQKRYKSDYDKKHCKGIVREFIIYLRICMLSYGKNHRFQVSNFLIFFQ